MPSEIVEESFDAPLHAVFGIAADPQVMTSAATKPLDADPPAGRWRLFQQTGQVEWEFRRVEMVEDSRIAYDCTVRMTSAYRKRFSLALDFSSEAEGRTRVRLTGNLLLFEYPAGKPLDVENLPEGLREGYFSLGQNLRTVASWLNSEVLQRIPRTRDEVLERTYNAGMRELFTLVKDPALLVGSYFVMSKADAAAGDYMIQDPTGSLKYHLKMREARPHDLVAYDYESSTASAWTKRGVIEFALRAVDRYKTTVRLTGRPSVVEFSDAMKQGLQYLPKNQIDGYLTLRTDIGSLAGWLDAAVPIHIPHIRDVINVQGDLVTGTKVDIRDSVVTGSDIGKGGGRDDGKYLVNAPSTTGTKVDIRDSVVTKSSFGGVDDSSLRAYRKALAQALSDGRIDESEEAMLETLRDTLSITAEAHRALLEEMVGLAGENVKKYARVLMTVMRDGSIDPSEEAMLASVRESLGVTMAQHAALLGRVGEKDKG